MAAGLGTRLRPITNDIPKCLVPIDEKPLLFIWLEQLHLAGVSRFYINTHYFAEQVVNTLKEHPLYSNITLFNEPCLLGTAGSVKAIIHKFKIDEDCLIAHADNLCLCDWNAFFQFHYTNNAQGLTMMGFETETPQTCGILEVDKQNNLLAFHEKVENPPGNLANGAVYIFSQAQFKYFYALNIKTPDISLDVIPQLLNHIKVWPTDGYLRDIGNMQSYNQALVDSVNLNAKYHFL